MSVAVGPRVALCLPGGGLTGGAGKCQLTSTSSFGGGIVTAVELVGSLVMCPEAGIMRSVSMAKNTSRNSMMSIIGMISIRGFLVSR